MKTLIPILAFMLAFSINSFSSSLNKLKPVANKESKLSFITYKVSKGENLKVIAKKFHIPAREIAKLNENVFTGLTTGQSIKIPRPKRHSFPRFVSYKMEAGDDFKSIIKRFNTTEDEILLFNPEGKSSYVLGHEVKLPTEFYRTKHFNNERKESNKLQSKRKNNFSITYSNIDKSIFFTPNYLFNKESSTDGKPLAANTSSNKTYKIAILLPFYLAENLQDSSRSDFKKNTDKIVAFYEGVLMAVDSMRKAGLSTELYVFDTEKSDEKAKEILKNPELASSDLIIGPAYNSQIKLVGDFAKQHKINVVSPLSPNSEILPFNEYLFQIKPSQESQIAQVAKYLSLYWDKNLVVAHSGSEEELDFARTFKKKMSLYFTNLNGNDTVSFKEYNTKNNEGLSVEGTLSSIQDNFVIIPSTNESYVINLLNRLNTLSSKYRIVVFGMPDWQKFSNLEIEQIHHLQLHYFSNYFTDPQDPNFQAFARKCQTVFKMQPDQYLLQGYDIGMYFFNKLKTEGKNFQASIGELKIAPEKPGLQSQFKFERVTPIGGFINTSLFIVRHTKDFEYTKIDPSVRIEYFKDFEIEPTE